MLNWLRRLFARQSREVRAEPGARPSAMSSDAAIHAFFNPPQHPVPLAVAPVVVDPWPKEAVDVHRHVVDDRLSDRSCQSCGGRLAGSRLLAAKGGAAHDDMRLTPEAAARAIASTERVLVACSHCGAPNEA